MKIQSCVVSICGVTVKKDKHQNKVQKIKDQLRDLCQAKMSTLLTTVKA